MNSLSKNKNKKIIIAVSVLLAIAVIATSIAVIIKVNNKEKVSLYTVGTGDISESVGATGKVTSGTTKKYSVETIARVKEVFVSVGDEVKKGDKLATFDTSELDKQIANLEKTYSKAKAEYHKAAENEKDSKSKLSQLNKEIAKLEKDVENQKNNISDDYFNNATDISNMLKELMEVLNSISDDAETVSKLTKVVMDTISSEIKGGNYSPVSISKAVETAIKKAVDSGEIDPSKLNFDLSEVISKIKNAINKVDWNEISSLLFNNGVGKLASSELRLAALYAEREILSVTNSVDVVGAKKDIMDATKVALDTMKDASSELKTGWVADFDGTITSCDIKPNTQTSALTTGITLQNLDTLIVTVSVGEYDIHKIKVGMDATVSTAYGKYSGQVISKAPTASGGSEGSILDSVGSMAGISGLSSLTDKGAGVEVTISVNNPDENIIVGFNADVEIKTGEFTNITTVPIKSIILEKTGTYVYLYDEKEKSVTKTLIETGAFSDSVYEVTSGIKVGDKIVDTPSSDYKENTFDVKVIK